MEKKKSLDEMWQFFKSLVIPENAHAIQKRDMKRAFYAGASMLYNEMTAEKPLYVKDVEVIADAAKMWNQELRDYAQEILERTA